MRMWGHRVTCKQQGEVWGTLICAVHSHWPHILHSGSLGQGGLSKLKASHRFEGGQIFSSWILRLTVFRVRSFFPFSHTPIWRGEKGKASNPHIHTRIQNGLNMLLQRVYFLWFSQLTNPAMYSGLELPCEKSCPSLLGANWSLSPARAGAEAPVAVSAADLLLLPCSSSVVALPSDLSAINSGVSQEM